MNPAAHPAREIHRLDVVSSTMTCAARLGQQGAPSGTVVVAGEQTSGQGRAGNIWHSQSGDGLYLSELRRETFSPDTLPVVVLALGLATAEAITDLAGVSCDLRWPNDVLIGSKKCAGILVQLQDGILILGIGINVNHLLFPGELVHVATSLRIETGRSFALPDMEETLLTRVDEHLGTLLERGKDPILQAFTCASSYTQGRRVTVDQGDQRIEGITDGLDSLGFLYVREDSGTRKLILAGGVRPVCS